MMGRLTMKVAAALPLALLLAGCGGADEAQPRPLPEEPQVVEEAPPAAQPAPQRAAERPPARVAPAPKPPARKAVPAPKPPDLRLEVNLAERKLHVYRKGERIATHPVAVGSKEWPTPTGAWTIGQVIWNPRWIPPTYQAWAANEAVVEPGDPKNPLGRAQLVYRAPNSIHGTTAPESLGKAVSHGSIRVSNEVAMKLARQVMEAGGAGKDEAWYREARTNRTERREVLIPNPVPIRVVAGK